MSIKLELEIVSTFLNNNFDLKSINSIAKKLNKAYPQIHKQIKLMIKNNLILQKKIGNTIACSVNLKNPLIISLYGLLEVKKSQIYLEKKENLTLSNVLPNLKKTLLNKISHIKSIFEYKSKIHVIIDTGNFDYNFFKIKNLIYSNETNEFVSDIIVNKTNKNNEANENNEANKTNKTNNYNDDIYVVSVIDSDYLKQLILIKNFLSEKIIFYGFENFYVILSELFEQNIIHNNSQKIKETNGDINSG